MDIQESLRNYIINECPVDQLPEEFDDDFDLIDSGLIDSLFMMSIIKYLEQEHQVEFGMNDMVPKHFQSVNALAEFVRNRQATNRDVKC